MRALSLFNRLETRRVREDGRAWAGPCWCAQNKEHTACLPIQGRVKHSKLCSWVPCKALALLQPEWCECFGSGTWWQRTATTGCCSLPPAQAQLLKQSRQ